MRVVCSVLFVVTLMFPAAASAGGYGQAYLPYWWSYFNASAPYENQEMIIYLANISGENISIQVSLYQSSGTLLQDGDDSLTSGEIWGGGNPLYWDDNPTDASLAFEIPTQKAVTIRLRTSTQMAGYGLIEWSASSKSVQKALVGHAFKISASEQLVYGIDHLDGTFSVPINGGVPF